MTAVYLLMIILGTSLQPPHEEILDLTAPVSPDVTNRAGCPATSFGIARIVGAPPPTMPLKAKLIEPEQKAYRLGDEVIFEVLIENIGQSSYLIPWAGEKDVLRVWPDPCGTPPGFRLFYLSLVDLRKRALPEMIFGPGIYGSELVPGSLKELKPGERVRIRSKGHLSFGSSEEGRQWLTRVQFPVTAHLTARLSALGGFTPATIPDPVISENTITISISK